MPKVPKPFGHVVWRNVRKRLKPCKRCGKRWCGTNLKMIRLYPDDIDEWGAITYGSIKCRTKGPKA